jgi:hypothetical protein
MLNLFTLFAHPLLHHPVLVLPFNGFQGFTGVMHWGAE